MSLTLNPQPGHSRLHRIFSIFLRTFSFRPLPPFSGGFAGVSGGRVTLSSTAISSLVSFSLGLDRPGREILFAIFILTSASTGLVREAVVTSMFKIPPSGRSGPSFR